MDLDKELLCGDHVLGGGSSILVITAVEAERAAVLRGLKRPEAFKVLAAGVGIAESAACTAAELAAGGYRLVVSAGIAGGFRERAPLGSVVIADRIIAADLGGETAEGYRSVEQLGFGRCEAEVHEEWAARLATGLQEAGLHTVLGPILTVSTVTGTGETAMELAQRFPGAAAEAMEGYGVAAAARQRGLPVLELRTISNEVGPRDRQAWRIPEALDALEKAAGILSEVLKRT